MEKLPKGIGIAVVVVVVLIVLLIVIPRDGGNCPGQLSASMTDVLTDAYGWDDLVKEGEAAGYDTKGETGHSLVGGATAASASISRVDGSSSRSATCFDDKPVVVAKIQSTADFEPLSLSSASDNYFVVWHNTKEAPDVAWHGAIINQNARTTIPFTFESHWQGVGEPTGDSDADVTPPDKLAEWFKECWRADGGTRRACFAEPAAETKPPPGMGFGLGILPLRNGGSQPWVSCAQYGCCCGGTSCHN